MEPLRKSMDSFRKNNGILKEIKGMRTEVNRIIQKSDGILKKISRILADIFRTGDSTEGLL